MTLDLKVETKVPHILGKNWVYCFREENIMKKTVVSEFTKYLIVGVIATIIDAGTLYFLTEIFDVYYIFSNICGFLAGLTSSYLMSIKYVFNHRTLTNRKHEFIIYSLIGLFGLVMNTSILWLFTDQLKIYYMVSKLLATIVVFISNFLLRKVILFRGSENV